MITNTYLNFDGNSEDAFSFYKSVFGGEFDTVMKFKDTPGGEEMSSDAGNRIMHISLPLGNGQFLMASDTLTGNKLIVGNNVSISLSPESREEADRIFNGLSAGGMVQMPLHDAFFGYFGHLRDKFGIQWMVSVSTAEDPRNAGSAKQFI
jgi:PhnB protein